ncbi:MAG TPA: NAD(P)/FAD-dependent oxidoreductase [Roseomonas sp.]|nr:NAD(P)/FAD-dependent oxidoreductase [Roseomonas sp.]
MQREGSWATGSRVRRTTVAIIGAGPAGLGMARVLRDLAIPDVVVFERSRIGASFRAWPEETRFITPSFPGNTFGQTDLNAISFDSSPAYSLRREHPDGPEYARYLEGAAAEFQLRIEVGTDVQDLEPSGEGFVLRTSRGAVATRFVIWAAGQFQYPDLEPFPGAEFGVHSSRVRRWRDHPGDHVIVIGGYESGIDAALGLVGTGKRVTVLGRSPRWRDSREADPSITLAPVTFQRLSSAMQLGAPIEFVEGADILGMERREGEIHVLAADGRSWTTASPPILATGFSGSTKTIEHCFDWNSSSYPSLSPQDESLRMPGLFLVGPEVTQGKHLFCFIYKFRQRFAVVGRTIAGRLGVDTAALDRYRTNNMYLDDLTCCEESRCLC